MKTVTKGRKKRHLEKPNCVVDYKHNKVDVDLKVQHVLSRKKNNN